MATIRTRSSNIITELIWTIKVSGTSGSRFYWQSKGRRNSAAYSGRGDYYHDRLVDIYALYEEQCEAKDLVVLVSCCCVPELRDNAELLAHYRQRFRHILVDEFQDTNAFSMPGFVYWRGRDASWRWAMTTNRLSLARGKGRFRPLKMTLRRL